MKQQTEDVVYVEDNYTLMCNYLYDKFPNSIEQREFMQSTLESWENAKITRSILEDYQRTNEEKRKYFYDKFCSGEPKIHITIADRKQGKTMFTVGDMLFELRRRGWKIYTAFPFPELWINSSGELGSYFFFWNQPTKQKIKELKEKGFFKFNSTFVLPSEIPRDEQQKTFRYYDELALEYPARDSNSQEALQLTSDLSTSAHDGITTGGGVQDLRFVDKNYVSYAATSCIVYKYYTTEGVETREELFPEIIKKLMPKPNEKEKVLIKFQDPESEKANGFELVTFSFEPKEFTKAVSHYMGEVKKHGVDLANKLLEYYDVSKVEKICKTKYSIELPFEFWAKAKKNQKEIEKYS